MAGTLYIGTRRYSSWSLRGWLMVRLAGLDVEDVVIPLGEAGTAALAGLSPNRLVPYLEHDGARIWDSLAIAEYCAELAPALWPADRLARAHARCIAAEMHAGFAPLRRAMPMNLGRHTPGFGQNPESLADIRRVEEIIATTRAAYGAGGPYLFGGAFNAADAMFAPVMARFLSYEPPLAPATRAYAQAVRAQALVAAWYDLAAAEPAAWQLAKYEELT